MADADRARQAAVKGFAGHAALMDPDAHVAAAAPTEDQNKNLKFLQGDVQVKSQKRSEFDLPAYQDPLQAKMDAAFKARIDALAAGHQPTQEEIQAAVNAVSGSSTQP